MNTTINPTTLDELRKLKRKIGMFALIRCVGSPFITDEEREKLTQVHVLNNGYPNISLLYML